MSQLPNAIGAAPDPAGPPDRGHQPDRAGPPEDGRQADPGGMEIYSAGTTDLMASQQMDPLLRFLTGQIVRHAVARLTAGARILDVGCGVGRTSVALAKAGFNVQGVDPSPRAVDLARVEVERTWDESLAGSGWGQAPRFEVGDATKPIHQEWREQFDGVVCSEVIEHVESPGAVIDYCAGALRPGGWAVVTTPHQRGQWTAMDTYAGHVTRFEVAEVSALLQSQFRIARLETEGFPFQRMAMKLYDASLKAGGQRHEYEGIRDRPAYRAYVLVMPLLLLVDHLLRGVRRGTTIVAVAQKKS